MKLSFVWTEKSIQLLAIFIAELVRQGVVFEVKQDTHGIDVTLTGGF